MQNDTEKRLSNGLALLPLIVFIAAFLGSGIIMSLMGVFKPFSQMPSIAAALLAVITAFVLYPGKYNDRMKVFLDGVGRPNIMTLFVIFFMAGAFSNVMQSMGGVDSVVNLCLTLLPAKYIVPGTFLVLGTFLIGCVISFASGTSMGTAVTVPPIALGIVEKAGVPLAVTMAAVLGGAMFGNQLSMLSDLAMTATSELNFSIKDKMAYNCILVIPPFLLTIIILLFTAAPSSASIEIGEYSIMKIVPYVLVLILAMTGMSVVLCLGIGTLLGGIIGMVYGLYTPVTFCQGVANGAVGMGSLMILAMLIGGMSYMVDKMGGINFIVDNVVKAAKSEKSAHACIAVMAGLIVTAICNDTITVMIACPFAKEICKKYKLDPRAAGVSITVMAAALGPLLPWSAFTLTVQNLANQAGHSLTIMDTWPVSYYPILLIVFTFISMWIPYPMKALKKPWDFDSNCVSE